AGFLLEGPRRVQAGAGRGDARHPDPDPPGGARLSGDARRSEGLARRARGPRRRDDQDVPGAEPHLSAGRRQEHAGRVPAARTHSRSRARRQRRLDGEGASAALVDRTEASRLRSEEEFLHMPTYDRYEGALPRYRDADMLAAFMRGVYGWMCGGLAITAVTAGLVASSPALTAAIFGNRAIFWILALAQLGIVFALSARVDRMATSTATLLFVAYSALTGVTLSSILLVFTGESVFTTFVVAAGMFGALAMYGTVTRRHLSGLGQFLFMGLIGLVLASIVGIFWHNDAFQFLISFVGVIVFAGLTLYDAQRLKALAFATSTGPTSGTTIVGALTLYLDFINLFLFLLRFLGNRRNDWG